MSRFCLELVWVDGCYELILRNSHVKLESTCHIFSLNKSINF